MCIRDSSSIDSDLKEIKQQNQSQSQLDSHGTDTIPDSLQKFQDTSYDVSAGSDMDSLVLEDILIDKESKGRKPLKEYILIDESGKTTDDPEVGMEDENNFDLKPEEKPETNLTETDLVPGGLEELKLSGLEDKHAESRFFN